MTTRDYYWIVTRDERGKPYLISAAMCKTESEVRQRGMEMLGGLDFEIKKYPTRDIDAASAYHRGKRLARGDGLRKSTQRLGHNRSLRRMLKRRNNL